MRPSGLDVGAGRPSAKPLPCSEPISVRGAVLVARRALLVAVAQSPLFGTMAARATTDTDILRKEGPGTDE